MKKLQKFEYIVSQFLNEYSLTSWKNIEEVSQWINDLSILKIQKLLFFMSTKSKSLLDDFSFNALPYWPVNIETYKAYGKTSSINISTRHTKLNDFRWNNQDFLILIEASILDSNIPDNKSFKIQVEESINELKIENPHIFTLEAFDLVRISHKWSCWKNNESDRKLISKDEILNSVPHYR